MTNAAIVLAGGGASRFVGSHKLLTPFRGRPLAAWAIDAALGSGVDEVIIVTGAVDLADLVGPSGLAHDNARVVPNPRWQEGQATSLAAGIDAAVAVGHDAVVVGLADQPLIPMEAWRRVAPLHRLADRRRNLRRHASQSGSLRSFGVVAAPT